MAAGGEKTCGLCCHEVSAWAVGACDHPSCLACCARLRVLCDQKECPVCRVVLDKVVVVEKLQQYSSISLVRLHGDRKYGLYFESPKLQEAYASLRENKCTRCPDQPTFRTFKQLSDHDRKTHDLFYCDICRDNLKLFPSEFKAYTRQELTKHRREGDSDDTSHKGHPHCKFCDERFLDNDVLHAHLRHAHFWCHFCEHDGKQEYYCDYPLLRQHFKKDHFLCEEGPCKNEKLTNVFRSKIDLQAHRAKVHTRGMSKAEAKQLRKIEVGFTVGRGGEEEEIGFEYAQPRGHHNGTRGRTRAELRERDELALATALSASTHHGEQKRTERKHNRSPDENCSSSSSQGPREQSSQRPNQSISHYQGPPQDRHSGRLRKPPGFESAAPSGGNSTIKTPIETEWPDLTGPGVGTTSSTPQPPPMPPPRNPPGFHYLLMTKQPLNIQSHAPPPPGMYIPNPVAPVQVSPNMGKRGIPPPGFADQYIPGNSRIVEAEVIERVRKVFNYDQGKFTQFMTLSGWYRNGELSVQEYSAQCRELLGRAWEEIGPQLARVLPSKTQRKELLSLFRGKHTSRRSTNQASVPHSAAWHSQMGKSKRAMLNDEEYPTLSSAAGQPDPPRVSNPWSTKVASWLSG